MSVFSFRPEPQGRGFTRESAMASGLDAPLSLASTYWESTKGGFLENTLGTALRTFSLPDEAPTAPKLVYTPPEGAPVLVPDTAQMRRRGGVGSGGTLRPEAPEALAARRGEAGAISEDDYKASAHFREGVQWDAGMTQKRAAAIAEQYDVQKVRDFYAAKRPVTAFFGMLTGAAADPVNYIPVFGEEVAAANVARFGRVAGRAITASADAAANTAIAALATAPQRAKLGDDVSWQAQVSQIAMGALVGSGFRAL